MRHLLITTLLSAAMGLGSVYAQNTEVIVVEGSENLGLVPVKKLLEKKDYAGVLTGRVYRAGDSAPIGSVHIRELSKEGKPLRLLISDAKGRFVLPMQQVPDTVEFFSIGSEKVRILITEEMVKSAQKFYLPVDKTMQIEIDTVSIKKMSEPNPLLHLLKDNR